MAGYPLLDSMHYRKEGAVRHHKGMAADTAPGIGVTTTANEMFDWGPCKPWLTVLALPPVPFLLITLVGARLILPRRGLGWALVLVGVVGVWITQCQGLATWVQNRFIKPPQALAGADLDALEVAGKAYARNRRERAGAAVPPAAIVALGGGREAHAPEYGMADLSRYSAERLRYAVWLARRTGLPLGFSGGVGWGQRADAGPAEADIAAHIAQSMYGMPLRWTENQSADTRQNAAYTVAMLAEQQVAEIVLVTHAFHMPRAQQDFEEAAALYAARHPGTRVIKIKAAPMGFWLPDDRGGLGWLPSSTGAANVPLALRECLAKWLHV